MKEVFSKISNFLGAKYKGFYLVNKDGKKFSQNYAQKVKLKETFNALELTGELYGYSFNINFSKENNGSILIGMNLSGKTDNDVRRLTPLVAEIDTNSETNILTHDFFNSGVKSCSKNQKGKSIFHIGVGEVNGKNHFTMINVIPSKFFSAFTFSVKGNKTEVGFVTDFPYTYEGEYFSETARLYIGMSTTDAMSLDTNDMPNRNFERPIGWSTWDYYFRDVSDECIKENTDFIYNDKELKSYVKYIAIDDGWEQVEGDWFEGGRIKSGLKATAEYIKSKGFEPGIWTAPVRVDMLSGNAMRRLKPALVKNDYGDPHIYDAMYVLDPTHPQAENFIKDIYTYLKSCGFTFYKIDFLDYITNSDYFYDKTAGHYDVLRKLLAMVRECVGKDAHVMGCNMPFGVGDGVVQSRRVGLDIHNHWGHIVKCMEFYLTQFATQDKIYQNDLDYLVVRGAETGDDSEPNNVTYHAYNYFKKNPPKGFVWRQGEDFSYNEAKFWATIVLMSGSSIFLGDRLSRLNERGLGIIKRTLKNADYISAKPIDTLMTPASDVWYKENGRQLFAFNWTEEDKIVNIDVEKLFGIRNSRFTDVYTDAIHNAENGIMSFNLKPHESVAVKEIK